MTWALLTPAPGAAVMSISTVIVAINAKLLETLRRGACAGGAGSPGVNGRRTIVTTNPQTGSGGVFRSGGGIVLIGFAVVAAFYLWTEHRALLLGVLPWLLILSKA